MTKKLEQQLESLPKKPGCYLFRDDQGVVLYVGKAKVLRNRVRSYFHTRPNFSPAKYAMMRKVHDIETVVVASEMEALILESILIKKYEPHYNVVLKDDKHYLFIKVTVKEDFPRVLTVRRIIKDGSRYFGPFTSSFAVRDTLRLLQKIFPYRTCELDLQHGHIKDKQFRACLRHHLGRCDAPCIEEISCKDYRDVIDKVLLFLEGKLDFVVKDLEREMKRQADQQNFEKAARMRDQIRRIEHLMTKQVVLSPKFTNQDVIGFVTDREKNKAFASLMLIREGKVLGQQYFVMNIDPSNADDEIVRAIILNYYEHAAFFPQELLVSALPNDVESITKLLQQRAASQNIKHKIKIRAVKSGAKKRLVSMAEENAQEYRSRKIHEWNNADLNLSAALKRLADTLDLSKSPERVEIYDISNIQGTSAVGSMVVFIGGKPAKNEYRRFKIATLKEEPNDVGMMKEVLRRRLRRFVSEDPRWPKPDLIIVDGGKAQLGAAVSITKELDVEIPVAGLAKREEQLFVPDKSKSLLLPKNSAALHLVQRMRDEAHRFAITFHRQVRSRRGRKSLLDEIVGIGPQRKKKLIQKYGSVSAISEASETELSKIIGEKATKSLLDQLH